MTARPGFRTPAERPAPRAKWRAQASPIPVDAPVTRTVFRLTRGAWRRSLRAASRDSRRRPRSAAPLVVAVQRALPGEADPAVHLDRPLARGDGRLGRVRLRCRRRQRRVARFPPRRTTRPSRRATEPARLDVHADDGVGDRLVDADQLARRSQLFACSTAQLNAFYAMPTASPASAQRRAYSDRPVQRDLAVLVLALAAGRAPARRRQPRQRAAQPSRSTAGVESPPELLEQHRLLDEAEPGATRLLGTETPSRPSSRARPRVGSRSSSSARASGAARPVLA